MSDEMARLERFLRMQDDKRRQNPRLEAEDYASRRELLERYKRNKRQEKQNRKAS